MGADVTGALVGLAFLLYSVIVGINGLRSDDAKKQMWASLALFFGAILFGLWVKYWRP